MHSLAIALHQGEYEVSGSDDRIFDPARSRLASAGILPEAEGWDASRITKDLDAIILGMHAFEDNPELNRAKELGIPIYSFPEFIYQQSQNKHRVVVAGSYGKTTVTSMIMHVLNGVGKKFDYVVGAQVPGFDNPVKLTKEAPILIAEGDEYLASKLDMRPKFLLYKPHVAVITGISWDHINVFPSEMEYIDAFASLVDAIPKGGTVIYRVDDPDVTPLVKSLNNDLHFAETFKTPDYKVKQGQFRIKAKGDRHKMSVIGKHNMDNIAAAQKVCFLLGVGESEFFNHISTFEGAKSRLEEVYKDDNLLIFKDFAHAPIKVKATVEAVRELYPDRNLVACVELHTFSSLNKQFLPHYKNALKPADTKVVFIQESTFEKKRMEPITGKEIVSAFGDKKVKYLNEVSDLDKTIKKALKGNDVLLMMSSADFGGWKMG